MTQKELLEKIPEMVERQDDTTIQMADLEAVAVKLGMRDAAEWIREVFFKIHRKG